MIGKCMISIHNITMIPNTYQTGFKFVILVKYGDLVGTYKMRESLCIPTISWINTVLTKFIVG